MEKESLVEKISGSLAVNLAATGISAAVGGPLAALLPVLSGTPAALRHKKRIERCLKELNQRLNEFGDRLRELTDEQFQFIAEVVNTILRTTNDEKIEILKNAVEKSLEKKTMEAEEVSQLSRLLRDITVEEAKLLVDCIGYSTIFIDFEKNGKYNMTIKKATAEYEILGGLVTLGLVHFSSRYADVDAYYFSDLAHKLVNMLR
jgi:predicted RNase H-like nuclease (RuvC/YqgF family)